MVDSPFKTPVAEAPENEEIDESREPVSLADAASSALGGIADEDGAAQPELEGMDYTKVRFVGVSYDALETAPEMGTEMEFVVRGRVTGHGEEEMADGHIRKFAKVKVSSVVLREDS